MLIMGADYICLFFDDQTRLTKKNSNKISFVRNLNFDIAVFVGKRFMKSKVNNFGIYLSNVKAARKWLNEQDLRNAHILMKASRGIAIEKIIDN